MLPHNREASFFYARTTNVHKKSKIKIIHPALYSGVRKDRDMNLLPNILEILNCANR